MTDAERSQLALLAALESDAIVRELVTMLSGKTKVSAFVALLLVAREMETMTPELRPYREAAFPAVSAEAN